MAARVPEKQYQMHTDLKHPSSPTQAHTQTPKAETRRNNKKLCRNIYFKIEAIDQLCTDLWDSCLCCFSAGACETLPVAAK